MANRCISTLPCVCRCALEGLHICVKPPTHVNVLEDQPPLELRFSTSFGRSIAIGRLCPRSAGDSTRRRIVLDDEEEGEGEAKGTATEERGRGGTEEVEVLPAQAQGELTSPPSSMETDRVGEREEDVTPMYETAGTAQGILRAGTSGPPGPHACSVSCQTFEGRLRNRNCDIPCLCSTPSPHTCFKSQTSTQSTPGNWTCSQLLQRLRVGLCQAQQFCIFAFSLQSG